MSSQRLTDRDLYDIVVADGHAWDQAPCSLVTMHAMARELIERRALDLTKEEASALRHAVVVLSADDDPDPVLRPWHQRAIAAINKILRGVR